MSYTPAGARRKLYYKRESPMSKPEVGATTFAWMEYADELGAENQRLRATWQTILQEVNDLAPWAYTYRERPDDLLEIRASDLEAILRAALGNAKDG
jgi:hypothetical protein